MQIDEVTNMRAVKKPVIVDVWQLDIEDIDFAPTWAQKAYTRGNLMWDMSRWCWQIDTLEGKMLAYENDYLIRGVKGELYPCKRNIFEETYEIVE